MDIEVSFPGGLRVDARVGERWIHTDQPAALGGADEAVAPFDLFLASLATCAGVYALGYCRARQLSTEGLRLVQHVETDPATKLPSRVELRLDLPPSFPSQHRAAIQRAVGSCKVKKAMLAPPSFDVVLSPEPAPQEIPHV